MDAQINVTSASEDHISFRDFTFNHHGCAYPMSKYRNPATDQYTLRCGCGFEVRFDNQGPASEAIVDAMLTQSDRTLPTDSYVSDQARTVIAHPASAS